MTFPTNDETGSCNGIVGNCGTFLSTAQLPQCKDAVKKLQEQFRFTDSMRTIMYQIKKQKYKFFQRFRTAFVRSKLRGDLVKGKDIVI